MPATRLLSGLAFAGGLAATAALAQTTVPLRHFESVALRGGGHVVLRHGAVQRVTLLKGSTRYTTFSLRDSRQLVIDACNSDCPMQYDLEIEIVTPAISGAAVAGGGAIMGMPGFPLQGSIAASVTGGGHVDLRAIPARAGNAAVDGGGHIDLQVKGSLTAAVDGGGSIRYEGNPAVTSAINGGGSIRPEGG